jgi:hypothetical protein
MACEQRCTMALAFSVFHQEGNRQRRRAAEQARKCLTFTSNSLSFFFKNIRF